MTSDEYYPNIGHVENGFQVVEDDEVGCTVCDC